MTEVVAQNTVLSDSTFRTRPHFNTILMTDSNAMGNAVQQIEQKRLQRQMKFPSTVGRKDVDSFKDTVNLSDRAFKKWNDEGDHRPNAPFRSCDNILDPLCGFVSIAGDVDRNTGHTRINSLVQLTKTPQSGTPQEKNSIRAHIPAAPPETKRYTENDPGTPYNWNSRKMSDATIRANLGGW